MGFVLEFYGVIGGYYWELVLDFYRILYCENCYIKWIINWFIVILGWMGGKYYYNGCFLIYKLVGIFFLEN